MARKKTFGEIKVALATFDTQDNLVRTNEDCKWEQNLNLDDFTPLQGYGLRRFADNKLWFKSQHPIKGIRLNNFRFFHKVKKLSQYHFEVECKRLQEHFDGTDYVEVLITKA